MKKIISFQILSLMIISISCTSLHYDIPDTSSSNLATLTAQSYILIDKIDDQEQGEGNFLPKMSWSQVRLPEGEHTIYARYKWKKEETEVMAVKYNFAGGNYYEIIAAKNIPGMKDPNKTILMIKSGNR